MLFSIVIPTYNNKSELIRCLDALEKCNRKDFEVFICVDGSTDGTLEELQKSNYELKLNVLEHPDKKNHGRGMARNLALEKVTGKYTVFLDSDMDPEPGFLDAHLEITCRQNCISLGEVIYRNRNQNYWAKYIGERGIAKFSQDEEVPFHYFITPNTCLESQTWKNLTGFDTKITGYGGEDMELGYRISKNPSGKFIYNPAAKVFTVQEKSFADALLQLEEYGKTGLPYIVKKWPELSSVYYVNKVNSKKFSDKFFELFTNSFFRKSVLWVWSFPMPWFIKKFLMNYLVVAHIHTGYKANLNQKVNT